eukprot:sb/3466277/
MHKLPAGENSMVEYRLHEGCLKGGTQNEVCDDAMDTNAVTNLLYESNVNWIQEQWRKFENIGQTTMHREKRQVIALAGMLALASTGFTIYEQQQMRSHIKTLSKEFNHFKTNQLVFDKTITTVTEELTKHVIGLEEVVLEQKLQMGCEIDHLAVFMLNDRRLRQWKEYLEQIYFGVMHGQQNTNIAPYIIKKDMVRQIIENSGAFKNTIYEEDQNLLYKFGRMYVTEAHKTDDHFNLHIVIKTPRISNEDLTRVYKTHQSGVITSEGHCNRYTLPNYVIIDGMEVYSLDKNRCETLNGINMCTRYGIQNMTETACLNNMNNCDVVLDKCETNIVETTAGVMIRSREK